MCAYILWIGQRYYLIISAAVFIKCLRIHGSNLVCNVSFFMFQHLKQQIYHFFCPLMLRQILYAYEISYDMNIAFTMLSEFEMVIFYVMIMHHCPYESRKHIIGYYP